MNSSISTPTSLTSFSQLIGWRGEGQTIREVEIPLIQRDYAQGRKTESVNRIRENFIDSLCKALLPDTSPMDLDFIFGDVESQGKFYPLDGQQRLTTMFLLHCYLAWRVEVLPQNQSWRKFSYATRPGARDFCDFLVRCHPVFSGTLSEWIKDHADYLPTWQYDPSIQSMLVVLDALHSWFTANNPDLQIAWRKLVDEENPAIRFHVLSMKANGLTDALYIKMNSRGKPLTSFENFKAHFEDVLKEAHPDHAGEFAKKVDTIWSNILWPYRGDDNLVDDEFMRYFRFITEVCAWKDGIEFKDKTRNDDLAEKVYGATAKNSEGNLTFLFQAFDVWERKSPKDQFERILTCETDGEASPLLIFNTFDKEGVDFFHACCRYHGMPRQWSLAHTLLLYGVLLGFIHQVAEADFSKRLRMLRNLVDASGDEIRAGERNNMPKLLGEVEQIIVHADLKLVRTFNQVQVRNEGTKSAMLQANPTLAIDLYRLEDHDLLRGGLTVFDLDPEKFALRSQTFIKIFNKSAHSGNLPWNLITAALLAKGDYSRQSNRWTGYRSADFGAPKNDEPWRDLFRVRKDEEKGSHSISKALTNLIDAAIKGQSLQDVIDEYLNDVRTRKDWRYYLVKYESMREGASGRYTIHNTNGGYQACMLKRSVMRSYYYDPYLLALVRKSKIDEERIANEGWPCCFYGYENDEPRTLVLKNSGIQLQSVDHGFKVSMGATELDRTLLDTLGINQDNIYKVPQDNDNIDVEDRIELGAKLLSDFVKKGL